MKLLFTLLLLSTALLGRDKKPPKPTALEEFVSASRAAGPAGEASPGSAFTTAGRFGDLGRDLRASNVGDMVTIVVSDRASAVSRGATASSRKSSAKASVPGLFGTRGGDLLPNLAQLSGESSLDGQGSTSRSNTLNATLTARVVEVLPNGFLVLEGTKDVQANSEKQRITVRGVARWNDVSTANTIRSDRVGQVEIRIDGKGVVADATRRPNILYRILMGILPF
jgi:flagellar L-ring protein FlgH